ncbi:MAG TPA: LamG-like jellyroll fold domain-containing protein [Anaerolineales bacterium]|jgi:uncharacterized repeat protein (TIGR02543 family)
MQRQFKTRLFSVISIFCILFNALGIPTQNVLAAPAGTALSFSGSNQYAKLGSTTQLRSATFTVELWFKRTAAGVGTGTGSGGITSAIPLITKGRAEAENANADVNYFFGIDATSGKLVADFEEAQTAQGGTNPGLNHPITGTAVIAADSTWHHAAATYDGTTWNLYLDGALDGTLVVGRPANAQTTVLTSVGSALNTSNAAAGFFAGVIDEVRIWSVARSLTEINDTKNVEITSAQPNLLGIWNLNEGSGTSLSDSSGNSVTGSTIASPTWVPGFPIPDSTHPAAPTGLAATGGNTVVNLAWSAPADLDVAGYNVYRSETSPVALTSPINGGTLVAGTTYVDTGRTNGITYYYAVTAVDTSANESVASTEADATPVGDITPPAAPTGLAATAGNRLVNLTWTANGEPDLAGYNLYRSATSGGPYTKVNSPLITGTSYSDTNLVKDTPYYYVLSAVDTSTNVSGYSGEVTATPFEINTALRFDGTNDYVTFGAAPELGAQNFTIETWFKRIGDGIAVSTGSNGVTAIPLVTKGSPQADGSNVDENYVLGIRSSDNVLAADFETFAACNIRPAGDNNPIVGVTPIVTNTWYHAAFTYDGTALKLYLNGNLEATLASTCIPRYDSIQHAGLGTYLTSTGTASGFFNGLLDEVRIWNVAHTQAEIRNTINSEITSEPGLVARWGLNEGGGTIAGSSTGPIPGTLTNGPVWITPGAPFNLVFDTTPPAAPTNLMASPRPGAVQLEWTANTETDMAGYRIYRSTSTPVVKGTPITGMIVGPSYLDSTVTAGTTYYYAVVALDSSDNESGLSNEASAVPLAPPPADALYLGSNHAYVALGDNADTAQFTLETWLRRDGAGVTVTTGTGGVDLVPLITNGTSEAETAAADINYFFGIRSDGVLCADFEEDQTGTTPGLNHPVCGTTALVNGVWYHAAVTYDGTTMRLYSNGDLYEQQTIGKPANTANTSSLAFGTSMTTGNATQGFFDGTLDEVRIWNYARTQAQIVSSINTKLTGPETGLLGRWGLDEASGSTVNDSSGNSITGSVNGTGYSWVPGATFNATVNLPPTAPELFSPLNNATNVSTPVTLSVNVTDPENHPLDVTFYGRPIQGAAGPDFSLVVIPDPQYYASTYPSIYNAQMNWVANNKTSSSIVFVAGLGDNVDVASNATQWTNAANAWDILDTAGVPYGLTAGNHDGAPSATATFNSYFGTQRFTGKSWYGGHYGSDNDNHYELFTASGLKFIVIFIEYDDGMTAIDHPVLQWANGLLQTNGDRQAIIVTHNLLNGGTSTTFSTQGQTIYNALKANPNLFMILGGHLDVAARRTDVFNGNTVYSLRSDYQSLDSQQSGYLRIMRFSPADDMIYVRTYSPTQNKDYDKADAAQNNFVLPYVMGGAGFSVIGTAAAVASGRTASVSWSGLDPAAQYEWFAIASDGTHQTSSDSWNFTSAPAAPTCYALTLSHTGEGSDPTTSPANSTGCPAGQYVASETISLSGAIPVAGWQINGWIGTSDDTSTANANTLSMPAGAHSASVNYSQIDYSLTVVSAHGTVTKDPVKTTYHLGDVVTLSVTADPGWTFSGWTPNLADNQVTISGNTTVTANYSENVYMLTINKVGNGTVTTDITSPYHYGDVVSLTATADIGWVFTNWSGDVTGTTNTANVTMLGNKTVTATFAINTFTLTYSAGPGGTLTGTTTQTVDYGNDGTTVTAVPNTGYHFVKWSDDSTANPRTDTNITANVTVTATFAINTFTLTYSAGPGGTLTGTTTQTVDYGNNGTEVIAVPNTGYHFVKWSDDSTANPRTDTNITANVTVTATFTQNEYILTVTSDHGAVTRTPDQPTYHMGDVVTLSVVATPGWTFTGWTPALVNNEVTITGDTSVTANFTQNEHTLTVTSDHGAVTRTPDQPTYHMGDVVTLSVVADPGWTFTGWTPALVNNEVTITGDTTVTANFTQNEYTLTVTSDHGAVTRIPDQPTYHMGDVVTLSVVAEPGWTFTGWTPALVNNEVTITGDTTVTANFTQDEYTLTVVSAHGAVTRNPDQPTYHMGDVVSLSVAAEPGWTFTGWTPALVNNKVTITGNTTVTANFTLNEYTLTLRTSGSGSITADLPAPYHYGDQVTLTAVPVPGWHFVNWSGDASGTTNPLVITIDANKTVTATFARDGIIISGNVELGGVTLTYNGGSPVISNIDGTYTISVPYTWSGTVSPSKAGYTFTPTSRSYKRIRIGQTDQNYTPAIAKPSVPVTLTPTGTINTTNPIYTWQASYGAGSYLLAVYNQNTRTNVIFDVFVPATACASDVCSYQPPNLTLIPNTSYKFSVAAVNSVGSSGYGNFKAWRTFKVSASAIFVP